MKKSLKKILDELNTESPRLDYIKGMLEVMIDEEEPLVTKVYKDIISNETVVEPVETATNEANTLDAYAAANLEKVMNLAQQSNG